MPSFDTVVQVVREEREYQNSLPRNLIKVQDPLTQVALIEEIIRQMKADFYSNPGEADMNFMRKICATAFRSLEEHGAPRRSDNRFLPTSAFGQKCSGCDRALSDCCCQG
jgi:hypothetical protein